MAILSDRKKIRTGLKLCMLVVLSFLFLVNHLNAQNTEALDLEMSQAINSVPNETIPGISVALASKEGLLWSGAAGYSDIEEERPVSQSHLFAIGDVSSQYVATLITQLARSGALDLDETPVSILGNTVSDIDNADQATIRQLLNHTSGIYSWSDNSDWKRRGRGIQLNPKYRWQSNEQLKYATRDYHEATSEPGDQYRYSKTNYSLLGLIVEQVTGGLLEEELRNQVLIPNNLKDTYYDTYQALPFGKLVGSYHLGTSEFISKVGVNASFGFAPGELINTTGATLSPEGFPGAMASTPRDTAIFLAKLWNSEIVKESDLDLFKPGSGGNASIHSETLGFTVDVRQIGETGLVLVSAINVGIVDTGDSDTSKVLRTYVDDILVPVAKKYADTN